MDKHLEVCIKYQITCSLCGDEIFRENLNWHLTKKCTERAIDCPYEFCGCLFRVKQREMEEHVISSVKTHIDLFTNYHKKSEEQKLEKIESMINLIVTTTKKRILSNSTNVNKMFNLNFFNEVIPNSM